MTHLSYLFAAYTIIWLVLFGYIYSLSRRNRGLRQELDALKDILTKQGLKEHP